MIKAWTLHLKSPRYHRIFRLDVLELELQFGKRSQGPCLLKRGQTGPSFTLEHNQSFNVIGHEAKKLSGWCRTFGSSCIPVNTLLCISSSSSRRFPKIFYKYNFSFPNVDTFTVMTLANRGCNRFRVEHQVLKLGDQNLPIV